MRPQHTDFIIMLLRYGVLLPGNSTFFISRASLCPLATLYRDLKKKKKKFILCISFKWKLLAFRVHWCVNDLIEVFSFSMFFASLVFRFHILSFNLDKQLRYNIIWKSLSSVNYIFWTEYKGNMLRINISQSKGNISIMLNWRTIKTLQVFQRKVIIRVSIRMGKSCKLRHTFDLIPCAFMQVCTWYANARKNSKIMLIICDTLFKVHKAQKYTINLCEYQVQTQ